MSDGAQELPRLPRSKAGQQVIRHLEVYNR